MSGPHRLTAVTLDERVRVRRNPEIQHECDVAIHDLVENNSFRPLKAEGGPYRVALRVEENRIVFDIVSEYGEAPLTVRLWLAPLQKIIKDYFTVCESYYKAIPDQSHARIELLDMARRSLHNEGAELLRDILKDKIEVDADTARRLFTLVCVLHLKG